MVGSSPATPVMAFTTTSHGDRLPAWALGAAEENTFFFDPALDPPSVEHGEVHDPVQGALHAAGSAGLAGTHGGVEPQVDPLSDQGGDLHIVVVDEDDGDRVLQVARHLADFLEQGLAAVVAGVGFSREDKLYLAVRRKSNV